VHPEVGGAKQKPKMSMAMEKLGF